MNTNSNRSRNHNHSQYSQYGPVRSQTNRAQRQRANGGGMLSGLRERDWNRVRLQKAAARVEISPEYVYMGVNAMPALYCFMNPLYDVPSLSDY